MVKIFVIKSLRNKKTIFKYVEKVPLKVDASAKEMTPAVESSNALHVKLRV